MGAKMHIRVRASLVTDIYTSSLARPLSRAGFYVLAGFGGRQRRIWAYSRGKHGAIGIVSILKGPGGCLMCHCVLCGPVPMAQTLPAGHMQPERQVHHGDRQHPSTTAHPGGVGGPPAPKIRDRVWDLASFPAILHLSQITNGEM